MADRSHAHYDVINRRIVVHTHTHTHTTERRIELSRSIIDEESSIGNRFIR